jgi:hypothetical protein
VEIMNLKIILFVLILAIIPISSAFAGMGGMNNNTDAPVPNTGGFYFAVDVTADMIENQLVIDAPAK